MKKRKVFTNAFIASLIAAAVAQGIGMLVSLNFWIPVVLPSYGWLITGAGMSAVPFVLYLVIYLPLIHFLSKKS